MEELVIESQMQSVFTDIGKVDFRDPCNYQLIPAVPGLTPNSTASAAWLSSDGEALFALPSASGGIFVLKLPPYDIPGMMSVVELKQSSVMQRLLIGWMPTAIRGDQGPSDRPLSLAVHCVEHDAFIFALCQDHKLRMWSFKDQMCLMVADILEYVPVNKDLRLTAGTGHKLRLAYSPSMGLYLGVYMHAPKRGQFCIFQLVSTESNRYSLDHISSLFTSQETLIDFALTSTDIWALWHDAENQTVVKYINFEHNVAGQWNPVFMQPLPDEEIVIRDDQDPRIFCRGTERNLDLSWSELKKEVTLAVENVDVARDVICLIKCLRLIGESVTTDMSVMMEMSCFNVQSPEKAAEQILEDLITIDVENVMEDIYSKLQEIRNPIHAIGLLIREMDYETEVELEKGFNPAQPLNIRMNLSQLYGGSTAGYIVCRGVCKIASTRFLICRDLLILQQLLMRLGDAVIFGAGQLFQAQQDLLHRTAPLLLSYYLIKWGSQCLATDVPVDTLWPSNPGCLFLECLMGNCQYVQLQNYIQLLNPWCQVNVGSCRFMLGRCYLVTGEGQKALQCFCQAASEVGKEEFLDRLIRSEDGEIVSTPRLQYYDKATLRTCIFKHHLDLGHNSQAYEALTQIPDSSRQLDCLRQLVVVLCERSQLQDLVEFPYVNLHNEVVGIIESRARAVDLMTHNYYELLYAFHIYRHNYRKAGTVMFEYGMRLGREVRTLRGLEKQGNCYLAALNCLRLIRPEYAWIVQPAPGAVYDRPGASPKRNHDGECTAAPRSSSAEEMVTLLVQAGLFDTAISLCQTFKLPLTPVFEGLAFKCIKLQFGGEAAQAEAWAWLAANQLSSVITTKESRYSTGAHLALEEAVDLVSEYVDAVLGKGHQYFGIEFPLSATSPMVWLPYSSIDQLLQALGENSANSHNIALSQKILDKLEDYQQKVDKATRDFLYRRTL
ncbi:Nuclear pore complex protein Nup160 [Tupaia chinensis]|uniref:Nuclear pore complex protein Nup160 n=1 Tax=Tupaia chinensis TaxID=246437 RepID=L9JEX9_TUPCH|nr:Nuclear pore complex protein Nup160 [Tupaia chinensis]